MKHALLLTISGLILCSLSVATSAANNELGWTLDSALKQLERQTKDFDTALADVEAAWTDTNGAPIRSTSGRVLLNREG